MFVFVDALYPSQQFSFCHLKTLEKLQKVHFCITIMA